MAASDFVWNRQPIQGADVPYKNTSGSAITAGMQLKLDTGNLMSASQGKPGMTPTTAVTDIPDGVAVENVPAGQDGRCQIEGIAVCIAKGAVTAGTTVGPSTTAGSTSTFTSTDPSLGKAWNTTVSDGDPVLVRLNVNSNNH